jgi:phosphoheptose isomerase
MELKDYLDQVRQHLSVYDSPQFEQAVKIIEDKYLNNNWIFFGGNGGSNAIVEHFATDWSKGVYQATGQPLKTFVLNSNSSLSTAISNDLAFDKTLSFPLSIYAKPDDLLVLVSSSGTSPNIINAFKFANQLGLDVIALSGFGSNSKLLEADVSINIDSTDYQVIEDVHHVFGHLVLKFFFEKYNA